MTLQLLQYILIILTTVTGLVGIFKEYKGQSKRSKRFDNFLAILIILFAIGGGWVQHLSKQAERDAATNATGNKQEIIDSLSKKTDELRRENSELNKQLQNKTQALSDQFERSSNTLIKQIDLSSSVLNTIITGGDSFAYFRFNYDVNSQIRGYLDNLKSPNHLYDVNLSIIDYDSVKNCRQGYDSRLSSYRFESTCWYNHVTILQPISVLSKLSLQELNFTIPYINGKRKFIIDYDSRNRRFEEQIIIIVFGKNFSQTSRVLEKKNGKMVTILQNKSKSDIFDDINWDKEFDLPKDYVIVPFVID